MAIDREATTIWTGDLQSGKGQLTMDSSHVGGTLDVSAPSRFETPDGQTSPEELIAAAHSSCYSMALSMTLSKSGNPPERLETHATCTIDRDGEGFTITKVDLRVRGTVPGIRADDFLSAANAAKDGCPVSKALAGNLEINLDAALA